jgi:biotin carboxylase
MPRILIVGTAFATLTTYLENHNYDYIVLKDQKLTKSPDKRLKHRVVCDFSSQQSIMQTVDSIKKPIDGILTTYENYILPSSWIAHHLKLPGMTLQSAEACTDKYLMRALFAKAPEKISPEFAEVVSEDDVKLFAHRYGFPLILKPANLAKSLLVTKNHDINELLSNYRKTLSQIHDVYTKYAPHRRPKLIIEEFLEGSIHSVDAFVGQDGEPLVLDQIVDYQTGYDIGFDDNFHYSRILPSKLTPQQQDELKHCAATGIKALGMKNSPAHIEIIMTKAGPRIVEIGARNGGYRERMHKLANGIDIQAAALALAFGEKPIINAAKNDPCAVLELLPKQAGNFKGIKNEEKLRDLPSLQYLSIKAKPGQYVGKAADGYKMCAVIILHNKNTEQFNNDLLFVEQRVSVVAAVA